MVDKTKPMTPQEIREKIGQAKVIQLPSGITIRVKKLSVYDFLQSGFTEIPNEFYAMIHSIGKPNMDLILTDEQKLKNMQLITTFMDLALDKGCIEPKVMLKYDQDKMESHILYGELSDEDQAFLLSSILGK